MTTSANNKQTIAVIDYGMGNLHSAAKALEHVADNATVVVTGDAEVIARADRVVFPGVGAIRDCMAEIRGRGVDKVVQQAIDAGKPVLAICVGMQALLKHSEENDGVDCLGLLDGNVRFFGNPHRSAAGDKLKVPHMGWNRVAQMPHPLWAGIPDHSYFYFVHSYYVDAANPAQIAGHSDYGFDFTVAISAGNLFAVQFHPEKSHDAGLQLLRNFCQWDGHP
ncbi:imidazole glycerol phosphate synthase subunit HisH [Sinobacterium caligoides]|uniref:Imidazole glycerol phosphate synthase subunit HisH n=1 Tax=Sinobacterium caligoides TaxID=933926 RepID=A0A3N2DGM7_9GAMM|nr:imidazole glycerol phosphate synthase subunit HisH [Sinobacterium caligoides]ROR98891.1 imidazole glycerol phosphate synthase subunit HisH [Sinobacterium caligoides]